MTSGTDKKLFTDIAANHLEQWKCTPDGDMFFTHSSLLWPVKRGHELCMLKIVDPNDDEAHGADILRYFNGHGAVAVIERDHNVQLLHRITDDGNTPTLEQMVADGQDEEATHIICDVIERLHMANAGHASLPGCLIPFKNRMDDITACLEHGTPDEGFKLLLQKALDIAGALERETAGSETCVHGDVHHFNILHDAEKGWLAIDPKGYYAPAVYEYAIPLCNPCTHTNIVTAPERMDRHAGLMAARGGFDKNLLLRFTFLHAAQVAAWSNDPAFQMHWIKCAKMAAHLSKVDIS